MEDTSTNEQVVKYSSNRAWWTPVLLLGLYLPALSHMRLSIWFLVTLPAIAILMSVLYLSTHPTLTFSTTSLEQTRWMRRTTVNLGNLKQVQAIFTARQTNVMDPQTGEYRSTFRWYFKSPDDWAGKHPVQAFRIEDRDGHQLTISVIGTRVDQWSPLLLRALESQTAVDLGPRTLESLKICAR